MGWQTCFIHALLGILSYIFLGIAAVGSGIYLVLGRFQLPDGAKEYRLILEETRLKINQTYLYLGFAILSLAFIVGVFQASVLWKNPWVSDPKTIATAIIWLYYLVAILIFLRLNRRKDERRGTITSVLALCGLLLIILAFILVQFVLSSAHHYIKY